jgi:hypothetical protein
MPIDKATMTGETYRILQTTGTPGPRWIAFRKQPGHVGHLYVGHGSTREIARDIVAWDRRARQRARQPKLRVVERPDGFHVEQFDLETGTHFQDWPGPFQTGRAAELFMDDLASAAARGNPYDAASSKPITGPPRPPHTMTTAHSAPQRTCPTRGN